MAGGGHCPDQGQSEGTIPVPAAPTPTARRPPPEPHSAWYCPVHFFGHRWGIDIREECILSLATDIASFVDWRYVRRPHRFAAPPLLSSACCVPFLHEHFHRKVESPGFRLPVSTGTDRCRPCKRDVHRPAWGTSDCLEEGLADADSYRRLAEPRYPKHYSGIRQDVRDCLKASFPMQPPGYSEAENDLSGPACRTGLDDSQSRVPDGVHPATTPAGHCSIAPDRITSLAGIGDGLCAVLPQGVQPLFPPTGIDPGPTATTRVLAGALTRHYGYGVLPAKGSHVKLKQPGASTLTLPGNRPVVSPGIVKQVLNAFGGYPISRLPDRLKGKLPMRS